MPRPILHSAPSIGDEEISRVLKVLRSGHLESGDEVVAFEAAMSEYVGKKYAVALSSGFAAIHMALKGYSIGPGDEVIIPSYTCSALLNPILIEGAQPVIVDTDSGSVNISVSEVKRNMTRKTRAVLVPHVFGIPAAIDELTDLGVPVIEDCAQSLGGTYKRQKLGSFSPTATFSFYSTKMMASGDGGMLLTDDATVYETALNYRYYGHKKGHRFAAYNYKMNNIAAAIGIEQLKKLDGFLDKRRQLAAFYNSILGGNEAIDTHVANIEQSCYYRYIIRVAGRDNLKCALAAKGIHAGYGVLEGMHQLSTMSDKQFPNTSALLQEVLSIPLYPSLRSRDAERVAAEVTRFVNKKQ